MIPVQIHCPECQKQYLVNQGDLHNGLVCFQCETCNVVFGFQWPQPPGTTVIKTARVPQEVRSVKPTSITPASTETQKCDHCGALCAAAYTECPKCGVIFEKVRRIRPPRPVQPPSGSDVTALWDQIRANYTDEKKHEIFIHTCLKKNNLAFASSQYRAILQVTPHDELAKKMQNRIIDLATTTYVSSLQNVRPAVDFSKRKRAGMIMGVSILLIFVGATIEPARSLIAVGTSILVFTFVLRYFNNKQI